MEKTLEAFVNLEKQLKDFTENYSITMQELNKKD